jgi:hypothetical protein
LLRGDQGRFPDRPFLLPIDKVASAVTNVILVPQYLALGVIMGDSSRFTIICPCCEATLTVDADTGALLSHDEKSKPLASFDEMVKGLDKQKQVREQIFAQELSSMKDRDRILEEKFQEAMKRADKEKGKPYLNPLDID